MAKCRIDRTSIFLSILGLLFLWDLAYVLHILDPEQVPHIFDIFQKFAHFEFLRGFESLLHVTIFLSVLGYLVGVGLAKLTLYSSILSITVLRFLRLGSWLPFLLLPTATQNMVALGIAAVTLCSCYHYLVERLFLKLGTPEARVYVARKAFLQAFFFSLYTDLWWTTSMLFKFPASANPVGTGIGVLAALVAFLFVVNWLLRFNFELATGRLAIVTKEFNRKNSMAAYGTVVLTAICFVIWFGLSQWPFAFFDTSPAAVINAAGFLFNSGEIFNDMLVSFIELVGGAALAILIGIVTARCLSNASLKRSLFFVLPLTWVSPIVVWQLIFTRIGGPLYLLPFFLHVITLVGFLSFYPFIQTFWGLHDRPLFQRILLAANDALPIAFVAMIIGETFASTVGLGFMMIVTGATLQSAKGIVGFLITVALLVGLSSALRWIAKRLCLQEQSVDAVTSHAN